MTHDHCNLYYGKDLLQMLLFVVCMVMDSLVKKKQQWLYGLVVSFTLQLGNGFQLSWNQIIH